MEPWKTGWRALAPLLSDAALTALRTALANDDARLIQGATTSPPPLTGVIDWPCEAACIIAYGPWQGDALATVGAVEETFSDLLALDQALGEPAACRWLINAYDEWPRAEMRRNLLPEVDLELAARTAE